MLIEKRIRAILRENPLPDKQMQEVLERWMIYLVEEVIESIEEKQDRLATKDDLAKVIELVNARFEAMEKANQARFEAIDKRFEAIDKRFETVDKRFEAVEKRLEFMQWLIGSGVAVAVVGLFLVALKLFSLHISPH